MLNRREDQAWHLFYVETKSIVIFVYEYLA